MNYQWNRNLGALQSIVDKKVLKACVQMGLS